MAHAHADSDTTRRDFLYIATGATGAILVGSTVWPLIDQMNPDASVRALASIEVDFSALEEGAQMVVQWRGKPVFVRKRTDAEIEAARAVEVDALPDPIARNANVDETAPATDEDRSFADGRIVIMMGVCTHLGCVPNMDGGDFGGWYCPCHGSHYDVSGRIRRGPAPENLPIPTLEFLSDTSVRLG